MGLFSPRTLAGRVLLIILAGLTVALAASIAFFLVERERAVDRYSAEETATRILELARLPPAATPAPAGQQRLRQRIRWREVEALDPMPAEEGAPSRHFTGELRRLLAESLGEDPVVWITSRESRRPEGARLEGGRPEGEGIARPRPEGLQRERPAPGGAAGAGGFLDRPRAPGPIGLDRSFRVITVAMNLPGGRHALAEAFVFQPSLQIPAEAWASIALIFIVTAAFSVWAVRLAVQPVRMLADAAERLSRNIDEPPLPEKGAVEIRSATRAFNRMQDRLRRHVNSRALAFAAMSHDMRTPLTRLRLRLESLGENARGKISDDLDEIELLAKSTLELIRGLAPGEDIGTVDVKALVERLVQDCETLGQKIALEGECRPVRARALALRRVLTNLIENACKYGKDVVVTLSDGEGEALIVVADRGPGIPAEHLERVVYPFYRVEPSRNRGSGGTGLGLAIAKDIVEGHGGTLAIDNRAEGGLKVTIRLPR